MLFSPFLLVTMDFEKNSKIGKYILSNHEHENQKNIVFIESLDDNLQIQKKLLYQVLYIKTTLLKIFNDVCNFNINVLHSKIVDMDKWRLKEKIKHNLSNLQTECKNTIHQFDLSKFSSLIQNDSAWSINTDLHLYEANDFYVEKISLYTNHLFILLEILEKQILTNTHNEIITHFDKFVSSVKIVQQDIKDYKRVLGNI
jgi:hypothetical protein